MLSLFLLGFKSYGDLVFRVLFLAPFVLFSLYILFFSRKPALTINDDGIIIKERVLQWKEIKGFYVQKQPDLTGEKSGISTSYNQGISPELNVVSGVATDVAMNYFIDSLEKQGALKYETWIGVYLLDGKSFTVNTSFFATTTSYIFDNLKTFSPDKVFEEREWKRKETSKYSKVIGYIFFVIIVITYIFVKYGN